MTERQLTLCLAALAQPTRLRAMRELLAEGGVRGGFHAGEMAERLGRGVSGTAVHLKELERAGLVLSAHNGHAVFYQADPAGCRTFLARLTEALAMPTQPCGPGA